jgi:hypothetical protein
MVLLEDIRKKEASILLSFLKKNLGLMDITIVKMIQNQTACNHCELQENNDLVELI